MASQSTRQIMLTAGLAASFVKSDLSYIMGVMIALLIVALTDKFFDWLIPTSPTKPESEAS